MPPHPRPELPPGALDPPVPLAAPVGGAVRLYWAIRSAPRSFFGDRRCGDAGCAQVFDRTERRPPCRVMCWREVPVVCATAKRHVARLDIRMRGMPRYV